MKRTLTKVSLTLALIAATTAVNEIELAQIARGDTARTDAPGSLASETVQTCAGDCNDDGAVTVPDLVKAVSADTFVTCEDGIF